MNLEAHGPIVQRDVWQAVQRVSVPRGRRASSDRLLARLGVLRCGTCGARMVVGTSNTSNYWIYRCPPNGECTRRTMISATIVEGVVVEAVHAALTDDPALHHDTRLDSTARRLRLRQEQADHPTPEERHARAPCEMPN